MSSTLSDPVPETLGRGATLAMAATAGALAANLYYAQPVVALIGQDLGMSPALESLVVTAAQIGYAAGLVLLVPLGDVVSNRRLILASLSACILGLVGLALAPATPWLFAAMLLVGLTSVGAQMIVPLAAHFAAPHERGRVVGNVMTGLLGGILLARPLSSFAAGFLGWRAIFWISAAALGLLGLVAARLFPERRPAHRQSYAQLLRSLGTLFRTQPVLRRRALIHAMMFASFALFWTGAPLLLLGEPFHLSPQGVALFALSGVLGVVAAPLAGRLADRGHARIGTIGALALAALAMALAWAGAGSLAALVLAGILLDFGVQANLVIAQREIFLLDATIRNRLNAAFMATFFMGGALGSALTSPLMAAFGWHAVAGLTLLFPLLALAYFLLGERRRTA